MAGSAGSAFGHEEIQPLLFVEGQGVLISFGKLIKSRLVRNQRSLIFLNRQAEEHAEVGFHLSVAIDIATLEIPIDRLERLTHQIRVARLQTHTIGRNECGQHTVIRVNLLQAQRSNTGIQKFHSNFMEVAGSIRSMSHLHAAARRAHSL